MFNTEFHTHISDPIEGGYGDVDWIREMATISMMIVGKIRDTDIEIYLQRGLEVAPRLDWIVLRFGQN